MEKPEFTEKAASAVRGTGDSLPALSAGCAKPAKAPDPAATVSKRLEGKIDFLYHMTAVANLRSIFEKGLCSHRAQKPLQDISNGGIQNRRECRKEPCYGKSLHEYASTYLNPRNAMLFRVQKQESEICILRISTRILDDHRFVFSDRNASVFRARPVFTTDIGTVLKFPFGRIFSRSWHDRDEQGNWVKNAEIEQAMQAECLIEGGIPASYIEKVICPDAHVEEAVRKAVPSAAAEVSPGMFF